MLQSAFEMPTASAGGLSLQSVVLLQGRQRYMCNLLLTCHA